LQLITLVLPLYYYSHTTNLANPLSSLASYGSLARFTDVKRLRTYADTTVVGFGGDVSDMQYLTRVLQDLSIAEDYSSTGHTLNAANLHKYLSKLMYKRRSDFNPLWNQLLVAGLDSSSTPFLASVDLLHRCV